ncbi:unnamed protein product [Leptidea sinapis]|uniref:PDZ and LIM domain protein Zasp n=1 Tax=Leptidea sinapis TaxID=189913 RepID=A0A5E4Q3Q9_9NEOP|nr:unnamed protein product [Leptidea sinapis]
MAQLITVRLNKSDQQPLGFRLQGGKDFGTPLVVQKVNGGSAAERAGLQAGDALIRVNSTDVYTLRHQEAQDTIRAAGQALELTIQRGGGTWRPSVTPTGSLPRPGSRPLGSNPTTVTNTSLKANQQPSRAFGSGHNNVAKPFGYMNGTDSVKGIVNKQYNTPVNMYSDKTIAETLSAQSEVLAGGVLGVNFKKNEKTYDAEKSAVFKVLQEAENDPEPPSAEPASIPSTPVTTGLRHVPAPVTKPDAPLNNTGGLPVGQNICEDCERLITGVFVRIKDKNLHVECFKCATCGTSLKNQGYYNLNGKLYCDIHAKLVARQNPPASNLEPVTVPPGGRVPSNTYSTPLPPLSTGNYTNGSSSLFSPSSNLSGPKPFGSSIGSAYSPSLSPRSAPMSPARPTGAPPAPITTAPLSSSFAPNKNVKSIVWPPPTPPEDETPSSSENTMTKTTGESTTLSSESVIKKASESNDLKVQTESGDQFMSSLSSQESAFSSTVSFASTSMTSATTASSISKSTVKNHQAQTMQEVSSSSTVQSFSEALSSTGNSHMIHQSRAPGLLSLNCSVDNASSETKLMQETKTCFSAIDNGSTTIAKQDRSYENKRNSLSLINSEESDYNSSIYHQTHYQNTQKTSEFHTNTDEKTLITSFSRENQQQDTRNQDIIPDSNKGIDSNQIFSQIIQPNLINSLTTELRTNNASIQSETQLTSSHIYNNSSNKDLAICNSSELYSHSTTIKSNEENELRNPKNILPFETDSYIPSENIQYKEELQCNDVATTMNSAFIPVAQKSLTSVNVKSSNTTNSLKDAVTIAPDRPFNLFASKIFEPLENKPTSIEQQSAPLFLETHPDSTQHISSLIKNDHKNLQSTNTQNKTNKAAEPKIKQNDSNVIHDNFTQSSVKTLAENSTDTIIKSFASTQGVSSVKSAKSYFEQLDRRENVSQVDASTVSDTKGNITHHLERGVTPEYVDVPTLPTMDHKVLSKYSTPIVVPSQETHKQNPLKSLKNTTPSNSTTFQPVSDEKFTLRESPDLSRTSTPSAINKPAPIIPHYQMNLVTTEHHAPETYTFQMSGGESSRSPTPKLRTRSPAHGTSFKAQAPRMKNSVLPAHFEQKQSFLHQIPSTLQKDQNTSGEKQHNYLINPTVREDHCSNREHQLEMYNIKDLSIKEDTSVNQNYEKKDLELQNVSEYGNTTVQTTRKSYEEYERTQSAKTVEIKMGSTTPSGLHQPLVATSDHPFAINLKQSFPSSTMTFTNPYQSFSSNITNANVDTTRQTQLCQPSPTVSGANLGPVCDPTPSTGSSVGAAARGKAFGVSSAPKRGRGVLNKAVLPGSRVPLCGSCNGNIRGPFITALGRIWCPEHFVCVNATCRRPLQDIGFVEENGQLYCEYCFEQYIAPSCDKCHAKIKGDCLNAIGKHFHPECFSCVYCGKLFGNNPFFLEDGLPYCEADWNELFTTKCFACGFPVEAGDRWVEALNNNYHSQCFNCTVCKKNLEGQSFFAKGGRPFCKVHAR